MDPDLKRDLSDWIQDALSLYAEREEQFARRRQSLGREARADREVMQQKIMLARGAQRKGEALLQQLEALSNKRRRAAPLPAAEVDRAPENLPPADLPVRNVTEVATKLSFEERLISIFNDSGASITSEFEMEPFGVANLSALHRGALEEPEFQVMEGGMYRLVRDGEKAYVVPRPSLQLDDARYRSGGIAHLFDCYGFERDSYWNPIRLVRAATVRDHGGRWQVIRKGELKDGGG